VPKKKYFQDVRKIMLCVCYEVDEPKYFFFFKILPEFISGVTNIFRKPHLSLSWFQECRMAEV
jgi:hypothetical protein